MVTKLWDCCSSSYLRTMTSRLCIVSVFNETCTSKTVIYLALCNKCKLQYTQFTLPEFKVHFNLFTPTSHLVILLYCGIIQVVFIYTLNYCISMHWIFDNILSLAYGQVFFFFMEPIRGKYLTTDFIQIP